MKVLVFGEDKYRGALELALRRMIRRINHEHSLDLYFGRPGLWKLLEFRGE
jgi:hypothetical protein